MSIYTRHSGAWHEVKPSVEPAFSLPDVTAEGEVLTTTTDSYGWATLAAYTKEESDAKYATEEYVDSAVIGGGPSPGLVYLHYEYSVDWVDYFEWTLSPDDEEKYDGYVVNLVIIPEQSDIFCYRLVTGDGEYTNSRYFQSDIRNDGTGTIEGSVDNDVTKGTISRANNTSQRSINLDINSSWTNVYGRSYGGSDLSLDTFQIRVLDSPTPRLGFRVFSGTGRIRGRFGVYGYSKGDN